MNKVLIVLVMLFAFISVANADEIATTQTTTTDNGLIKQINDLLTATKAKEGIIYDVKNTRGYNFLATTLVNGTGALKGFSLDAGLVNTDGIGAAIDYNIGSVLPEVNVPVISLVNSLHVGLGGGVKTITTWTDKIQTSKDDNRFFWGPTIFISKKF